MAAIMCLDIMHPGTIMSIGFPDIGHDLEKERAHHNCYALNSGICICFRKPICLIFADKIKLR